MKAKINKREVNYDLDFHNAFLAPKATPAINKALKPPSRGTAGQGGHPEQNCAGGGVPEQHEV